MMLERKEEEEKKARMEKSERGKKLMHQKKQLREKILANQVEECKEGLPQEMKEKRQETKVGVCEQIPESKETPEFLA